MKRHTAFIFVLIIAITTNLYAQNTSSEDLIKQGIELSKTHNYTEASEKFGEVLKTEPENYNANFEMGYALYNAKKGPAAIPYLEKATKAADVKIQVVAFSVLGSVYDSSQQSAKAIEAYNNAIKLNPDYPGVYTNLGIAYSRSQQYVEAEKSAMEAIKHDTLSASNQRLYALSTFHQNKRLNALLGFCSFILLDPANSAESYGNIQHILQGGELKYSGLSPAEIKDAALLNAIIAKTVAAGKAKKLKGEALLEYELKNIFMMAGQLAEKNTDKTFFDNYYAAYFYKLAQSDNMPAFTRLINSSVNKDEYAKWLQANPQLVKRLGDWVESVKRGF